MASGRQNTEPLLKAHGPADEAPTEVEVHDTDPMGSSSESTTVPLGGRTTDSSNERAREIVQNLKPARVWSPKPALNADSDGAAFAAYHTIHVPARPRHVTEPRPVVVAEEPTPAGMTADTAVDLGTAVERAQQYEDDRRRRQDETLLVGDSSRPRIWVVALGASAVAITMAFVGSRAFSSGTSPKPQASLTIVTASPSPQAPPSPVLAGPDVTALTESAAPPAGAAAPSPPPSSTNIFSAARAAAAPSPATATRTAAPPHGGSSRPPQPSPGAVGAAPAPSSTTFLRFLPEE